MNYKLFFQFGYFIGGFAIVVGILFSVCQFKAWRQDKKSGLADSQKTKNIFYFVYYLILSLICIAAFEFLGYLCYDDGAFTFRGLLEFGIVIMFSVFIPISDKLVGFVSSNKGFILNTALAAFEFTSAFIGIMYAIGYV